MKNKKCPQCHCILTVLGGASEFEVFFGRILIFLEQFSIIESVVLILGCLCVFLRFFRQIIEYSLLLGPEFYGVFNPFLQLILRFDYEKIKQLKMSIPGTVSFWRQEQPVPWDEPRPSSKYSSLLVLRLLLNPKISHFCQKISQSCMQS